MVSLLTAWGLAGGPGAPAAESMATAAGRAPVSVALTFQEVAFPFFVWSVPAQASTIPFAHEPEPTSGSPLRLYLRYGRDAAHRVAVLWDKPGAKLYVDLNRNQDLTDDPEGVVSLARSPNIATASVRLPVPTSAGELPALMELSIYHLGAGQLFAHARLRSLWLGQVALGGRDWQVGLIDVPDPRHAGEDDRYFLLRPWPDRDQPFQIGEGGSPVAAVSSNLFVGGQGYAVAARASGGDAAGGLDLAFTPRLTLLGDLELTGRDIYRLTLRSRDWLVVLESPEALLRVPVSEYSHTSVRLRHGNAEAVRDSRHTGRGPTVTEAGPNRFEVGGPLTNSVAIERRGRTLVLNYRLDGAGGDTYSVQETDGRKAPKFAVYRGAVQVASGAFEFG